jgi:hypothetical protein
MNDKLLKSEYEYSPTNRSGPGEGHIRMYKERERERETDRQTDGVPKSTFSYSGVMKTYEYNTISRSYFLRSRCFIRLRDEKVKWSFKKYGGT